LHILKKNQGERRLLREHSSKEQPILAKTKKKTLGK
jgi:hypothetical protein